MNAMQPLGVGLVGYAFMGAAHSLAWRTARSVFELPLQPEMRALCGRDAAKVAAAATRLGWDSTEQEWAALIARDDIDLVDICTPGDSHAEIAVAALAAGKHVLCEKPLANSVDEAELMADAADLAAARGIRSMVGFSYRRVPAIALARQLVDDGRVGEIRHVRAQYLQDWIVDPEFPLVWRLRREQAGSGALGDIGAHIVDLTQYITGQQITSVTAMLETFVPERPLPVDATGPAASAAGERGAVTVDDAALWLARFGGGAVGSFEATRFATGRRNVIRIEINGSRGTIAFDFQQMNELQLYDDTESASTAGFRTILVTEPEHPYLSAWWPPGHLLGYEHAFTHQAADLVGAIAAGENPLPSFRDGLQVQRVLQAIEDSARDKSWTVVRQ
ncbi:MAG: Gfo/Idh/MocA family oxidoreductase [Nocardioidaceae bacterium]